jgi:hypothetical protein
MELESKLALWNWLSAALRFWWMMGLDVSG